MTWFITVAIMGSVVWQAGPLTKEDCDAAKPIAHAYLDRIAAERGSVVLHGRTVTRGDVRVYCTQQRG